MIIGIGTDLVHIERIKKLCEKKAFLTKVYTKIEQNYCNAKPFPEKHYAGRYAAKEAILKAFGYGMREGISWHDMEIINNDLGKPCVTLSENIKNIIAKQHHLDNIFINVDLSLSDEKEYAIAFVILSKSISKK